MDLLDLDFCQRHIYKIVTKRGLLRPLVPNVYQTQLNQIIEDKRRRMERIRLQILKCRQVGITTWAASLGYHFTSSDYHKAGLSVADDDKNTIGIFEKAKMFWEFSDEKARPMRRRSNSYELVFANPDDRDKINPGLNSALRIETAGNLKAGRSKTVQFLHVSEMAFWPNAAVVKSGLYQAVPIEPGTIIINESTANGMSGKGEQFYNDWNDSDFEKIFFKWTKNPEYELDVGPDWEPTHYETHLMELHPELTPRKLEFRRYKIKNDMGSAILSPEDQYKQEYPLTPEESYIASGRPVFDVEQVRSDIERARAVTFEQGDFDGTGKFQASPNGRVRLYKRPKDGQGYAIGGDVAEGLETGDFSTQFVLSRDMEQAASYHGHIAPDLFGKDMAKMGEFYNTALLGPEINNHGFTVLTKLKDLEYSNIYNREVKEEHSQEITYKIGWQTNSKTKMEMLDKFVAAYRDGLIKLYDIELLKEMLTLTVGADGDICLNGKDRVVAAAIAVSIVHRVVTPGQFKAFTPGASVGMKDRTKMTIEEKLKALSKKRR